MAKKDKKKEYYVDNKELYIAMCDFIEAREKDPDCRVTEYIGDCILKISNRLASSPNFSSYSFKEEMIANGVITCVKYIHNFKPHLKDKKDISKFTGVPKKSNAFSYFTQCCWSAFLQTIAKEKKMQATKAKYVQNMSSLDAVYGDNVIVSTQGHDSNRQATSDAQKTLQFYYNMELPESKPKEKKQKKAEIDPFDLDSQPEI